MCMLFFLSAVVSKLFGWIWVSWILGWDFDNDYYMIVNSIHFLFIIPYWACLNIGFYSLWNGYIIMSGVNLPLENLPVYNNSDSYFVKIMTYMIGYPIVSIFIYFIVQIIEYLFLKFIS